MTSLERELRGSEDGHVIPAQYADLADEFDDPGESSPHEGYEDLRKSG